MLMYNNVVKAAQTVTNVNYAVSLITATVPHPITATLPHSFTATLHQGRTGDPHSTQKIKLNEVVRI
jgi:hypothetical protein